MLNIFKSKQPFAADALRDRYVRLCAQRDATNERVAGLQRELDALNDDVAQAQALANAKAAQIQAVRGGESWLTLKKEIGMLAKALSGVR